MKIVFFPNSMAPFHGNTLKERPLGGTETAVIRLAEALHFLGHSVSVVSQFKNPPLTPVVYLPLHALDDIGEIDMLVVVRDWPPLLANIKATRRFFWTGDAFDQVAGVGIGDHRIASRIDEFLAVSHWHAETTCKESGFPRDKTFVLGNGIALSLFEGSEERKRKRLIYSSTPYRGLALLPSIVTDLRARHPDLELHIFSGLDVYAGAGVDPRAVEEFKPLLEKLKNTPGCIVHGNVTQSKLAREFMRSSILAYPNTFAETSCITAMEAQAAGCPVVTSDLGALSETVGEAGILIEGTPGSPDYLKAFTHALDSLLSDDTLWAKYSMRGKERAAHFDWTKVAERFIAHASNL